MSSTRKVVRVLVEGGKATAGPPLGPALGPLGFNVLAIANKINELTKEFAGMKVPVSILLDVERKEYEVQTGVPSASALIAKELKIEKGSANPKAEKVGNLSLQQVVGIARVRQGSSLAGSLKSCVREVVGTCASMGVTVEGKDAREVQRELGEGKFNGLLAG